ncbi:MAG TPA: hypothetical protein VMW27_11780 [Thermoanaerobaculia bacterium]|nr:hypothetical protein [Thermoanaerobaculia bacterium]
MSKPVLRRLTVAAALATALWLGGSPAAHAGSFAIELPAVLDTGLFDRLAQWLGSLWGIDEAAKSLTPPSGGTPGSSTTGSGGTTEQGGTIDPDGVPSKLE